MEERARFIFAGLRKSGAVGVRHGFHPSRPHQLPEGWGPQDHVPARDLLPSTCGAPRHFPPELGGDGDPMSGRSPIPRRKPVQLTDASAGSVQLTDDSAGSAQLTNASAGPVQFTDASAGPV